jgi:phosphoenolpyruvate carboxykinase (ATP)
MYYFISGYTAKVAGTEVGVKEPTATFSPCFGGPFLVWHPSKYAELLAEKMRRHDARVWLVNTGWSGGPYGVGKRINLSYTRAIIDAIHGGALAAAPVQHDLIFGFDVVAECPGVPSDILVPRGTWDNPQAYEAAAVRLAELFRDNFKTYEQGVGEDVRAAGPLAAEEHAVA